MEVTNTTALLTLVDTYYNIGGYISGTALSGLDPGKK